MINALNTMKSFLHACVVKVSYPECSFKSLYRMQRSKTRVEKVDD